MNLTLQKIFKRILYVGSLAGVFLAPFACGLFSSGQQYKVTQGSQTGIFGGVPYAHAEVPSGGGGNPPPAPPSGGGSSGESGGGESGDGGGGGGSGDGGEGGDGCS